MCTEVRWPFLGVSHVNGDHVADLTDSCGSVGSLRHKTSVKMTVNRSYCTVIVGVNLIGIMRTLSSRGRHVLTLAPDAATNRRAFCRRCWPTKALQKKQRDTLRREMDRDLQFLHD